MKCAQVRDRLDDFRAGAMDPADLEMIRSHLSSCAGCSQEYALGTSEERLYRDYQSGVQRSLEVTPLMWQSVRSAIGNAEPEPAGWLTRILALRELVLPRSAAWRQAIFATALVALSVCGTLLAVRYHGRGLSDDSAIASSPAGPAGAHRAAGSKTLESALQSIQRAEREYIEAIRVLNDILEKRKATLDPRLVAELEANLKTIDESIEATRKAYHDNPTDPELAHYMLAAYSKKVELLQEMAS